MIVYRSMCVWECDSVNVWNDCRSMCVWEYDSVNDCRSMCVWEYDSVTV